MWLESALLLQLTTSHSVFLSFLCSVVMSYFISRQLHLSCSCPVAKEQVLAGNNSVKHTWPRDSSHMEPHGNSGTGQTQTCKDLWSNRTDDERHNGFVYSTPLVTVFRIYPSLSGSEPSLFLDPHLDKRGIPGLGSSDTSPASSMTSAHFPRGGEEQMPQVRVVRRWARLIPPPLALTWNVWLAAFFMQLTFLNNTLWLRPLLWHWVTFSFKLITLIQFTRYSRKERERDRERNNCCETYSRNDKLT